MEYFNAKGRLFLNAKLYAKHLGVSMARIRQLRGKGKTPDAMVLNRDWFYPKDMLDPRTERPL